MPEAGSQTYRTKRAAIEKLRRGIESAAKQFESTAPLRRVLNEWEVVFLLGAMARDSGYRLFEGSDRFPDAIIEVDTDDGAVQILAELEYRASRFNHDTTACDLVICWRQDVGRIGSLPIIELRPLFPGLDAEELVRKLVCDAWFLGDV